MINLWQFMRINKVFMKEMKLVFPRTMNLFQRMSFGFLSKTYSRTASLDPKCRKICLQQPQHIISAFQKCVKEMILLLNISSVFIANQSY